MIPSTSDIVEVVCHQTGVPYYEVLADSKEKRHLEARRLMIWCLHKLRAASHTEIAQVIRGRKSAHSSASNAIRAWDQAIKSDPDALALTNTVLARIEDKVKRRGHYADYSHLTTLDTDCILDSHRRTTMHESLGDRRLMTALETLDAAERTLREMADTPGLDRSKHAHAIRELSRSIDRLRAACVPVLHPANDR